MEYDVIIVGMGIAGISAAIYAKNSGLKVLLLESNAPGGLLNKINTIYNYPGYAEIKGPDLAFQLFQSILKLKIPYKIATVTNIKESDEKKIVETNEGDFKSSYVLLATGRKQKKLSLQREEKFYGKGISSCALCDGNLYEGKDVCVVGGGNSALDAAIYLANIVRKVYLVHRRNSFRAENALVKKVKEKENITILYDSQVTEILEEKENLSGVMINDTQKLAVSALFVNIGFAPNNEYLSNLGILNEEGYIEVSSMYETRVSGIYAVGDCIKKDVYQLVTASYDGVIAALSILKKIRR